MDGRKTRNLNLERAWGWTLGLGWGRKPGEGDARGGGSLG